MTTAHATDGSTARAWDAFVVAAAVEFHAAEGIVNTARPDRRAARCATPRGGDVPAGLWDASSQSPQPVDCDSLTPPITPPITPTPPRGHRPGPGGCAVAAVGRRVGRAPPAGTSGRARGQ